MDGAHARTVQDEAGQYREAAPAGHRRRRRVPPLGGDEGRRLLVYALVKIWIRPRLYRHFAQAIAFGVFRIERGHLRKISDRPFEIRRRIQYVSVASIGIRLDVLRIERDRPREICDCGRIVPLIAVHVGDATIGQRLRRFRLEPDYLREVLDRAIKIRRQPARMTKFCASCGSSSIARLRSDIARAKSRGVLSI